MTHRLPTMMLEVKKRLEQSIIFLLTCFRFPNGEMELSFRVRSMAIVSVYACPNLIK